MKKVWLSIIIVFILLTGVFSQVIAENSFPTKAIQVIVPYAAGGGNDQLARIFQIVMPKYLPNGQSIVVVNKPGGSTVIGTTEIFKAKPDGYTIGIIAGAPLSVMPAYGKTPYKHDSFQPIIKVASNPVILAVSADSPWINYDNWLDYVKKNPGKFSYSSGGAGSAPNLAMEAFNFTANVKTKHVPFDGANPAVTALLGGHVQGFAGSPQEARSHVEAGKFRIIANLGTTKDEYYKDVVMTKNKGVSVVSGDNYFGFIAPKGLPKDVLAVLHNAFKKALEDPEVIKQCTAFGISTDYSGPDQFQQEITNAHNANEKILKIMGLVK